MALRPTLEKLFRIFLPKENVRVNATDKQLLEEIFMSSPYAPKNFWASFRGYFAVFGAGDEDKESA